MAQTILNLVYRLGVTDRYLRRAVLPVPVQCAAGARENLSAQWSRGPT